MKATLKILWPTLVLAGGVVINVGADAVTLDECVITALKANPDVRAASARLEAARAAVKEATSAYYPQIGIAGNWARTDNPPQAFFMSLNQRRASLQKDFNNPDDTENVRASVIAQWRLYDGGRREADRRASSLGSLAADYALASVRNDLAYQVTRAYYGILEARDFTMVREESLKSLTETLRVATERHKAGAALKTDVLNTEVAVSQAQEDLIRARNGIELAVAALNTAVGRDMLTTGDVAALPHALPSLGTTNAATVTVERRPEWGSVDAQVRQAEAGAVRARRELMPTVSAFGSLDWDREKWSDSPERSYLAGVSVELNIFDGFRTRAGVDRASAGVVAARAQADKLRQALRLDLLQARLNEQEARERLVVAGKSVAGAEESVRITRERYRQGVADLNDLMMAEVGWASVQARNTAAHYDCLMARANVKRAEGASLGAGTTELRQD